MLRLNSVCRKAPPLCAKSSNGTIWATPSLSWVVLPGLGQLSEARQSLQEAIKIAAENESFAVVCFALPVILPVLTDLGQGEQAVELCALAASRLPWMSSSPWFEDIAGQQIADVAARLPPDVVAAAQARGRARDLWTTVGEILNSGLLVGDQGKMIQSKPENQVPTHEPISM